MKKLIFFCCVALLNFSSCADKKPEAITFKVLQFNIWQEGTVVPGGFDAIVSQIIQTDADFVTLSEVRNYNDSRFCDRIVKALKDSGQVYYSFKSEDSGLLSRFPIKDSTVVYPLKDDHGSAYRALIDMDGLEVALYTTHLDYLNDTYYDVYGYSGSTWEKRPPMLDLDSILANNVESMRDDGMKAIIEYAEKDREKGRLVFIGGDFNEPSHLDWVETTKDMYNHQGLVVPWTVNKMLDDAGYKDAFRTFFPNPVTHPGFTFPAVNKNVPIEKLLWAKDSDERERVDYIHYSPVLGLELTDVVIWGPTGSIFEGKEIEETTEDVFKIGKGIWPTDHKAVLATFRLTK